MNDTRPCPYCGGTIKVQARLCKHCREPIGASGEPAARPDGGAALDNPISRLWASTGSASWVRRARPVHLIGVSIYAALGLVSLTGKEIVLAGVGLVTSAVIIYLFATTVAAVFRANYAQGAANLRGLFDIVELATVSLLLANVAGFWAAMSDGLAGYHSHDTVALHVISAISFSSMFFLSIALVVALGIAQIAHHTARQGVSE